MEFWRKLPCFGYEFSNYVLMKLFRVWIYIWGLKWSFVSDCGDLELFQVSFKWFLCEKGREVKSVKGWNFRKLGITLELNW